MGGSPKRASFISAPFLVVKIEGKSKKPFVLLTLTYIDFASKECNFSNVSDSHYTQYGL